MKKVYNVLHKVIFILTTIALVTFVISPLFYWFYNPELTQMELFKNRWESFLLSPFFIIVYYVAYFEKP